MNRRKFLRNSSLIGLTVTAIQHPSFANKNGQTPSNTQDNFLLNEVTIDELQNKMETGQLTAAAITEMYLKRIEAVDKNGPSLNAVIELNPDAIAIATAMDEERKNGKIRGPLHGIPVLIKDNINTADKMMTTAGSLALQGNYAKKDAFIVARLREAGAVILGKTNLSEWANFRSTMSTSGWSSRGGQTRNPYILDRNPSGSSSGSAVAVAANLCAVAIGTETNGSIVSPGSVNGIVGFKPTVGLWSRGGIIPISKTQDTAGPMCRTVKDVAILLGALAAKDNSDITTTQKTVKHITDYTQFLDSERLDGYRIGVEKSHFEGNVYVVNLFRHGIDVLKSLGAEIIELDILKAVDDPSNAELEVLLFEFKDGINNYLHTTELEVKSLDDIINYNRKYETLVMPFFRQELLRKANEKGRMDDSNYKKAVVKTLSSRKIINDIIKANELDALCGVTAGPAGVIDLVNGNYDTGFFFSTPAAMAGFPHITLPMGFLHGLPVGISFFNTAFKEPQLLSIAYVYEQATKVRKAPTFKPDLFM